MKKLAVLTLCACLAGVAFAEQAAPTEMPEKVWKFLDSMAGTWNMGGAIGGVVEGKWDSSKSTLLVSVSFQIEGQDCHCSGSWYWDGISKDGVIGSWSFSSNQGYTQIRQEGRVLSDGVYEGPRKGVFFGKKHKGKSRIEFINPGQFTWKVINVVNGGEKLPDSMDLFTKVQPTTREDFKDWCKFYEGRWIGDIKWAADWPGIGKKGDTVTVYIQNNIAQDGNALVGHGFLGRGSRTGIFSYDADAQLIKGMAVSTGGSQAHITFQKGGGEWLWTVRGVELDGTIVNLAGAAKFTNNGNTLTEKGGGTRGEEKVEFVDVFHRVSK